MDVLADVLSSLRLVGGVVVQGHGRGDWCVTSQLLPEDCAGLLPAGAHLIAYHYVKAGALYAQVDDQPAVRAGPGSILLFPRNDRHRLFTAAGERPLESHEIVTAGLKGELAQFVVGNEGPEVEFYCGFLGTESSDHPLVDCLPSMLVVEDASRTDDAWLQSNLQFLTSGRQSPQLVARIAEVLFAHAVRKYFDELGPDERGWLAGLKDSAVARALACIHARYADELDVEQLAREAAVSRTVLGERFALLLGEPPMRYCARWRMRVAANLLLEGKESSGNIAYAVGFNSEAAFNRAFKREYGAPPATWKRHREAEARRPPSEKRGDSPLPPQEVRYCRAHDGTRLAWSHVGEGPVLIKAANWMNHIEYDWDSPVWRHWLRELVKDHCLIRYDERGNGLSDWGAADLSFDAFVDDLDSVVEASRAERFDLLGISQGAAVAIAYAVRHPERIRKLVIWGGYAAGWATRAAPEELARREAMLTLTKVGWGSDNPAYRHMFTGLYIPGGSTEQASWFDELQRRSTSPENAVRLQRALSVIDVRHLLHKVRVPTLIMHARGDQVVPFSCGEELARGIPGAVFVGVDGDNHILLQEEPAWATFTRTVREFLRGSEATAPPARLRASEAAIVH